MPHTRFIRLSASLALLAAVAFGARTRAETARVPLASQPRAAHVVVIGVDGLSTAGVEGGQAPRIKAMMQNGSYTLHARGVFPTSSSSNWMSMITGAQPEQHGVTSNDWDRDDHTIEPRDRNAIGIYPSMFDTLRPARPDASIIVVHHWGGFGRLVNHDACDVIENPSSAEATMSRAIELLNEKKPTLLFIHLDHVDHAGHESGWESPAYFEAVALTDRLTGDMLDAIDRAGLADSTVVILTSDHGGVGHSHGGESMAELEIPWIISGPGIAHGRRIDAPVNTMDTAGTVADLLGFELAPSADARPVRAAYQSTPIQPGIASAAPYLSMPRILPRGGRWVDEPVTVTLQSVSLGSDAHAKVQIRYTLDGSEPTTNSPLYAQPVTLHESATVRAAAFGPDGAQSNINAAAFRIVRSVPGRGARYELFSGNFASVTQLTRQTPMAVGVCPEIDSDDLKLPAQPLGARFTADFQANTAGEHQFWIESDDGSSLSIDGQQIIDNDGDHGPRVRSGDITLEPGTHRIEVLYFNAVGSGVLRVWMREPGGSKRILSTEMLTPPM